VVKLGSKAPGITVAQLISSRTIDPRVLHFVPEDSFFSLSAALTVPLIKENDEYANLLTALQKLTARIRPMYGKKLPDKEENPFQYLVRQVGERLATPDFRKLATSVHSATVVQAPVERPGGWQTLVILELKDQAAADELMDLLPVLLVKGEKPRSQEIGKHTIRTVAQTRNNWELPLGGGMYSRWSQGDQSFGREGNVVVIGDSPEIVARALQGGAARAGFAAQPDVARTLSRVKDANGLVLVSGRNLVKEWVRSQENDLATMKKFPGRPPVKLAEGKPWPDLESDLLLLYPQQLKKITADINKATQDLPAGFLTLTAKAERLTISGGQSGLQTTIPRLIDALVERDLSHPNLRRNREGMPWGFPGGKEAMPRDFPTRPRDFPGVKPTPEDPVRDPPQKVDPTPKK
jgi:hypothetical protein